VNETLNLIRIIARRFNMKKTLLALATAATVGVASIAAPTAANAQWGHGWGHWGHHHHFGWGAPVAAGVIGGLAAGALIGSAFGAPYYAYGGYPYGAYGGYPYGAYAYDAAPVGYAAAPCAFRSQRIWNGYGWHIRRVRVCY
jgi:hypothetical protein